MSVHPDFERKMTWDALTATLRALFPGGPTDAERANKRAIYDFAAAQLALNTGDPVAAARHVGRRARRGPRARAPLPHDCARRAVAPRLLFWLLLRLRARARERRRARRVSSDPDFGSPHRRSPYANNAPNASPAESDDHAQHHHHGSEPQ